MDGLHLYHVPLPPWGIHRDLYVCGEVVGLRVWTVGLSDAVLCLTRG